MLDEETDEPLMRPSGARMNAERGLLGVSGPYNEANLAGTAKSTWLVARGEFGGR